ncbi:RNA 2',3'-cyclic phosphodiesterase, partial [Candidatus Gribaldobacteria bacterium]|nr:RNA 2',3'-cyclic phosphodiesterase [Candidatus Gribaldobacteria bacterium]
MPRIFIALNLPKEIKAQLAEKQQEIKTMFPDDFGDFALKWVEPANLHLTLSFLGEVKESRMPDLVKSIQEKVKLAKSFSLAFKEIVFDAKPSLVKIPRLIWLATEKSEPLNKLSSFFQGENKNFIGHITLARVREWQFRKMNEEEIPQIKVSFEKGFMVKSIDLM